MTHSFRAATLKEMTYYKLIPSFKFPAVLLLILQENRSLLI